MITTATHTTEIQTQRQKSQAGISLMELIAALTVIAAIVIGALALYNSASTSQSVNQMLTDITSIRGSVRQLWQGQGSYGADGTNLVTPLVAAGRLPSTVRVAGVAPNQTLTHSLNGAMQIFASNGGNRFTMTLANIQPNACVALLTSALGWVSVESSIGGGADDTFPITPAEAAARCTGIATLTYISN